MRLIRLLIVTVLACATAWMLWAHFTRPVDLPLSWSEPLRSVSFAPFRRGQSPLTKTYPTEAQVEEDLITLAGKTRGIRTYSSREGMEHVPELAHRLGLKVIYSAWLGVERPINELEVRALIKAANAYPDEIERVIVGNEVLLRRDLKPQELIAEIRRVKAAVKQPVSYADVWAFFLKYPEVAKELDFLTIHILPFWEDEPVDVDHAHEHVVKIVERMRAAFPGKPILIGETGWPTIGRDRGPAVVNTVNAARFVRGMAKLAEQHNFDYNIVEAFDQPWKSALENTVGAAWGIMDIDRRLKFGMSGPVEEIPNWRLRAGLALALGAALTLFFGRRLHGTLSMLVLAGSAQVLAWLAITACFHAEAVAFRPWLQVWALMRGGVPLLLTVALVEQIARALAHRRQKPEEIVHFGSTTVVHAPRWTGDGLMLLTMVYAVVWTLLLLFDGRYRDIPDLDLGVPAVGLPLLALIRVASGLGWARGMRFAGMFPLGRGLTLEFRERLLNRLGWILPMSAVAALLSEGVAVIGEDFATDHPTLGEQIPLILRATVSNHEMLVWAGALLLMSVPFVAEWLCRRQERMQREL